MNKLNKISVYEYMENKDVNSDKLSDKIETWYNVKIEFKDGSILAEGRYGKNDFMIHGSMIIGREY